MRSVLVALTLATIATPALASGGIWCNAEDKAVRLSVESGMTRSIGGGFFNFRAGLDIRLPGTPKDFRSLKLDENDLPHHWIDDKEIKLLLYRERSEEPFGWVHLVIDTKAVDEGSYAGTYTLTLSNLEPGQSEAKETTATGPIECSAE